MAKKSRDPVQTCGKQQWQAHVRALTQSGLNRSEYCRQHDLSYHALTYWQRKIEQNKSIGRSQALVPVTFQVEPVRPSRACNHGGLQIILPNELRIAVEDNFSAGTLQRLLAALEGR